MRSSLVVPVVTTLLPCLAAAQGWGSWDPNLGHDLYLTVTTTKTQYVCPCDATGKGGLPPYLSPIYSTATTSAKGQTTPSYFSFPTYTYTTTSTSAASIFTPKFSSPISLLPTTSRQTTSSPTIYYNPNTSTPPGHLSPIPPGLTISPYSPPSGPYANYTATTSTVSSTTTSINSECTPGHVVATNGAVYNASCNLSYSIGNPQHRKRDSNIVGSHQNVMNLTQCLNYCQQTQACVAVDFYRKDQGSLDFQRAGNCFLLSNVAFGSYFADGVDAARVADSTVDPTTTTAMTSSITSIKNIIQNSTTVLHQLTTTSMSVTIDPVNPVGGPNITFNYSSGPYGPGNYSTTTSTTSGSTTASTTAATATTITKVPTTTSATTTTTPTMSGILTSTSTTSTGSSTQSSTTTKSSGSSSSPTTTASIGLSNSTITTVSTTTTTSMSYGFPPFDIPLFTPNTTTMSTTFVSGATTTTQSTTTATSTPDSSTTSTTTSTTVVSTTSSTSSTSTLPNITTITSSISSSASSTTTSTLTSLSSPSINSTTTSTSAYPYIPAQSSTLSGFAIQLSIHNTGFSTTMTTSGMSVTTTATTMTTTASTTITTGGTSISPTTTPGVDPYGLFPNTTSTTATLSSTTNTFAATSAISTTAYYFISLTSPSALGRKAKRTTQYLAFDQSQNAKLTSSLNADAFTRSSNGLLMTAPGGQYVIVQNGQLVLTPVSSANALTLNQNSDGSYSVSGLQSYCSNGSTLYVVSQAHSGTCQPVNLGLVPVMPKFSTTDSTAIIGFEIQLTEITSTVSSSFTFTPTTSTSIVGFAIELSQAPHTTTSSLLGFGVELQQGPRVTTTTSSSGFAIEIGKATPTTTASSTLVGFQIEIDQISYTTTTPVAGFGIALSQVSATATTIGFGVELDASPQPTVTTISGFEIELNQVSQSSITLSTETATGTFELDTAPTSTLTTTTTTSTPTPTPVNCNPIQDGSFEDASGQVEKTDVVVGLWSVTGDGAYFDSNVNQNQESGQNYITPYGNVYASLTASDDTLTRGILTYALDTSLLNDPAGYELSYSFSVPSMMLGSATATCSLNVFAGSIGNSEVQIDSRTFGLPSSWETADATIPASFASLITSANTGKIPLNFQLSCGNDNAGTSATVLVDTVSLQGNSRECSQVAQF